MIKNVLLGAIVPLILIGTGLGVFFGLQSPVPPQTELPKPTPAELLPFLPRADVATVRALAEKSETLDIEISGTVVPYREIQLAAEVAGRIIEKDPNLRSGNYVKKGQVLYRIDPRDYELELQRLRGRRNQELASVRELKQSISNSEKLLSLAEEEMLLADAEVARLENVNTNFSSVAELDQAKRSRLTSRNQELTLRNQIRTYETQMARLELAAELAETEIEQAELNLSRTVIASPVEGRIVSEEVEVDSYVQRGTPLSVIEDTEKVEVACNMRMDQLYWVLDQPEFSADQLMNAAQVSRFELPSTPAQVNFTVTGREATTYKWEGFLDRFDGAGIDPQSRTVPIRIRVDNPDQFSTLDGQKVEVAGTPTLVRGMFVDVIVKAHPATRLMLIPKLSIKPASNSTVIWKFAEDEKAVFATPTARASLEAAKNPTEQSPASTNNAASNSPVEVIDPSEWATGFLDVVEDVRMITSYWADDDVDYWVCEVPVNRLAAGDKVIISPLPGIKADGTDPVRVKRTSMGTVQGQPLAGEKEESGQS